MKFTEAQLEQAFIHLLQQEDMQHVLGNDLRKTEGNMVEESTKPKNILPSRLLKNND
jgi:type I restriction enzyme R subunit